MRISGKSERHLGTTRIPAREQARKGAPSPSESGPRGTPPSDEGLTAREWEVLRLIADRHASKQIADGLKISLHTVNHHREAVLKRLNVHSAIAAVKWYWRTRGK